MVPYPGFKWQRTRTAVERTVAADIRRGRSAAPTFTLKG